MRRKTSRHATARARDREFLIALVVCVGLSCSSKKLVKPVGEEIAKTGGVGALGAATHAAPGMVGEAPMGQPSVVIPIVHPVGSNEAPAGPEPGENVAPSPAMPMAEPNPTLAPTPPESPSSPESPTSPGSESPVLSSPTRPNIVFILVDDMGWSDVGAYGGEIETPNLDRLAMDGVRFTSFYQTGKCTPTRASLLNGTYELQTGFEHRNAATLGEVLRPAGYRTLMSGKHHSAANPYDHGFDRSYGLLDGAANHFNPGLRRPGEPAPAQKRIRTWMDDADVFETHDPQKQHYFPKDFYSTDAFTDRALSYLDDYAGEDKPFFLYLAYTAPHDPMHAPAESVAKYKGVYDAGYDAIRRARFDKQVAMGLIDPERVPLSPAVHYKGQPAPEQIERMEIYAGMMDRLDWNIGRIVERLKADGTFDNTLILFASDNGASSENVNIGAGSINQVGHYASQQVGWASVSNTPFRYYKATSYNGGVQSPLIAHWPAGIKTPGRVSDHPLHLVDVMPTLLELAQAEYPNTMRGDQVHAMQGISFAPLLRDTDTELERPPLFFEWGDGAGVRDLRWKLVKEGNEPWNLYDMTADMSEVNNLAAANPAVVQRLSGLHSAWKQWTLRPSPEVADDTVTVVSGGMIAVDVLANDPSNLDAASVSIRAAPKYGRVQVDPSTGVVAYHHTGNGTKDSFQYVAYSANGSPSHRALVSVSIQ